MALPAGSITQISFGYHCCGQRLLNVTHWVNEQEINMEIPDYSIAVANSAGSSTVATSPVFKMIPLLPGNVTIDWVRAQVIRDNRWAYQQKDVGLPGNRGDTPVPNTDIVITKRTIDSDRDQVGSFHLPGIDPADVLDGFIDPAFRLTLIDEMEWLKAPMVWLSGQPNLYPVILHPPTTLPGYTRVFNIVVQPEARVMVRRTVGRGE